MAESTLPPWPDLIAGKGCPFCIPQPDIDQWGVKIADLSVSTLVLDRAQTYRGYSLLKFRARHVTGIEQLTTDEYDAYMRDLKQAATAVFHAVKPDHMNYATLGNVIPHLHYHIIPRWENDPRWGAPVWTSRLQDMVKIRLEDDNAYLTLAADIRRFL